MYFCGELVGGLQLSLGSAPLSSPYAAPLPNDKRDVNVDDLLRNGDLDQNLTGQAGEVKNSYVLAERYLDLRVFTVLHNPDRRNVRRSFTHAHVDSNKGNMEKKIL